MALLSYEFMRRAFLAAIFIAGIAPMLGVFLVIRRQSLMADTLSHVSLAGVALGFFLNLNPTGTTLLVVVVAAIIMEYLQNMYSSYSEISIAILMAAGLAIALVLMSLAPGSSAVSIQSYLFGSIVTITWQQVIFLGILFVLVGILFLLFKRPMYVLTFDEDIAAVDGLPVRMMSMIFNVVTGVAIVIFVSVLVGFIGMIGGLTGSYYLDTPPGATITLGFILLFLVINGIRQLRILVQRKQMQN